MRTFAKFYTDFSPLLQELTLAEVGSITIAMLAHSRGEAATVEGNARFVWPYIKANLEQSEDTTTPISSTMSEGSTPTMSDRVDLRAAREAKGMTQKEVAQAIGVTQSCISKFEKGMVSISTALVMKLFELLEVKAQSGGQEYSENMTKNITSHISGNIQEYPQEYSSHISHDSQEHFSNDSEKTLESQQKIEHDNQERSICSNSHISSHTQEYSGHIQEYSGHISTEYSGNIPENIPAQEKEGVFPLSSPLSPSFPSPPNPPISNSPYPPYNPPFPKKETSSVVVVNNARERADSGVAARVKADFLDRINPVASPDCLDMLGGYAEAMGEEVCRKAFNIALDAKKANWGYIRAILANWQRNGVKCVADVLELDERHRAGSTQTSGAVKGATPANSQQGRQHGRKSPNNMVGKNFQPSSAQIKKSADWMDEFLAAQAVTFS